MPSDIHINGLDRFRDQFKVLQEDLASHKAEVSTLTKKLVEKQRVVDMYLELSAHMGIEVRKYSETAMKLFQVLELVAPKLPKEEAQIVKQRLKEVKEFVSRQLAPRTPLQPQQTLHNYQTMKRVSCDKELCKTGLNTENDPKRPRQDGYESASGYQWPSVQQNPDPTSPDTSCSE